MRKLTQTIHGFLKVKPWKIKSAIFLKHEVKYQDENSELETVILWVIFSDSWFLIVKSWRPMLKLWLFFTNNVPIKIY